MIVEVRDDTLALSGGIRRNEWRTLESAARLLLRRHPEGIILDCAGVTSLTAAGAETLRLAEAHLGEQGARLVVAALQPEVVRVLRGMPDLGSRLPIAATVAEARTSLGLAPQVAPMRAGGALAVILLGTSADQHAVALSAQLATSTGALIHLIFPLPVPRDLPLLSALGEEEEQARRALAELSEALRARQLSVTTRVERTRDRPRRILEVVQELRVAQVILALEPSSDDEQVRVAGVVLRQAPCPVLVQRVGGAAA